MDFQLVWQYFPDLLNGAWLTIELVALSLFVGFFPGFYLWSCSFIPLSSVAVFSPILHVYLSR